MRITIPLEAELKLKDLASYYDNLTAGDIAREAIEDFLNHPEGLLSNLLFNLSFHKSMGYK